MFNKLLVWWNNIKDFAKFYELSIDRVIATWLFNKQEFDRLQLNMISYRLNQYSHWNQVWRIKD